MKHTLFSDVCKEEVPTIFAQNDHIAGLCLAARSFCAAPNGAKLSGRKVIKAVMPPGTAAEGGEKARRAKLFVQTKSFQTTDKPTFLARGGFVSNLTTRLTSGFHKPIK